MVAVDPSSYSVSKSLASSTCPKVKCASSFDIGKECSIQELLIKKDQCCSVGIGQTQSLQNKARLGFLFNLFFDEPVQHCSCCTVAFLF